MKTLLLVLRVIGVLFLAVIVLAGVLLGHTVTRSYPQTRGTVKAPGLRGEVQVRRDANGVPHLYADNAHDLFLAQGYVHAQDRFYQMDFWRHITAGRLSEMFGESQLATDRFLRTLGWARIAEQEYATASPEVKAALEAYAAGVNAYIGSRSPADLSLEYSILGLNGLSDYQPEPWTPVNSIAWGKSMAWDLGGNLDLEIRNAILLQALGEDKLREYEPLYPSDQPIIVPNPALGEINWKALGARVAAVNEVLGGPFEGIGSNNWVLAGSRTTTGLPILANDPHLSIQMPAIWYLIGLHCRTLTPECPYDVVGYSLAGDPGVIIGHNRFIAWGMTNLDPDVQDLFIEKIHPAQPNQYEVNGQWVAMEVREETINVLDGEPQTITVRWTRNGPLIDEVYSDAGALFANALTVNGTALGANHGLALRWTALQPGTVFEAVLAINRARNWQEFRDALRLWDVPSQNFVYADVDGNIGYQAPGRIPRRANGDGSLPVPGWTDEYQWIDTIPFDELPYAFNPPQGYIATANNAVVGPEYKYLLATDWDYGYRAQRIVELIESRPAWTPQDMAVIQGDNLNMGAREVLPYLLALSFDEPRLQAALNVLRGWDLQMHMDSQPAAIYASFFRFLLLNTFGDELPEDYRFTGGAQSWMAVRHALANHASTWWDDVTTAPVETREEILRRSFEEGYQDLEQRLGADPDTWTWGRLHTATFRNQTLGSDAVPAPIRLMFNRGPVAASGGSAIVNATNYNINRADPYAVTSLPSMRMIVDLSDLDNARMIHTTGQSGHAFHRHYDDFIEPWRHIEYKLMPFSQEAVEQAASDVLVLTP